ncbi:hypothetical protein BDZ91DRAFT_765447 [Kalaharituber pfeilii]|nr:hypothetical protein BDZ91DRAFT_765447 [Kalaharituber pfeilii]
MSEFPWRLRSGNEVSTLSRPSACPVHGTVYLPSTWARPLFHAAGSAVLAVLAVLACFIYLLLWAPATYGTVAQSVPVRAPHTTHPMLCTLSLPGIGGPGHPSPSLGHLVAMPVQCAHGSALGHDGGGTSPFVPSAPARSAPLLIRAIHTPAHTAHTGRAPSASAPASAELVPTPARPAPPSPAQPSQAHAHAYAQPAGPGCGRNCCPLSCRDAPHTVCPLSARPRPPPRPPRAAPAAASSQRLSHPAPCRPVSAPAAIQPAAVDYPVAASKHPEGKDAERLWHTGLSDGTHLRPGPVLGAPPLRCEQASAPGDVLRGGSMKYISKAPGAAALRGPLTSA